MFDLEKAKSILKYFGYGASNVEPIIYAGKNCVRLFSTYKTKYGHLSRVSEFNTEESFTDFLKLYSWYRKRIKNKAVIVLFDDYQTLTPNITFVYSGISVTIDNLAHIEELKNAKEKKKREKIAKDTTDEDNLKLFAVLSNLVTDFKSNIDAVEKKLEEVVSDYVKTLVTYNEKFKIQEKVFTPRIIKTDIDIYKNKVNILKLDIERNQDTTYFEEFVKRFIEILYELKTDENYMENRYLIEYYNREVKRIKERSAIYDKYMDYANKKKVFKKSISIEDFYEQNREQVESLDKKALISSYEIEADNSLIELKNSSLKELKLIYGINEIEEKVNQPDVEITYDDEYKINSLNSYFIKLNVEERNNALLLNSPLKTIFSYIMLHDVNSVDDFEEDWLKAAKNMYELLCNFDNYSLVRKYLKFLQLDSFEEFVECLIDIKNKFNIKRFESTFDAKLKFKVGSFENKKYITASISNGYPINGIGSNDYYIADLSLEEPLIFSPYIIEFNDERTLECNKNDNIVVVDLQDYGDFILKRKITVYNYLLKTKDSDYKTFKFNEKQYIEVKLQVGA